MGFLGALIDLLDEPGPGRLGAEPSEPGALAVAMSAGRRGGFACEEPRPDQDLDELVSKLDVSVTV